MVGSGPEGPSTQKSARYLSKAMLTVLEILSTP